MLERAF